MKATTATKEKQFEPITLTLTIESRRELEMLLSLFAASNDDIAKCANSSLISGDKIVKFIPPDAGFSMDIFTQLSAHI